VQRRNAAYAFVSLLLVLLAPRNFWLSLACRPSRSMEMFSFASHSLSCLSVFVSISLSLFLFGTAGRAALCWATCSLTVSLPFLLYSLQGKSLSYLSFLLHSCFTLLLVLLAPNFSSMHAVSLPETVLYSVWRYYNRLSDVPHSVY
jgi:hypothetical protein